MRLVCVEALLKRKLNEEKAGPLGHVPQYHNDDEQLQEELKNMLQLKKRLADPRQRIEELMADTGPRDNVAAHKEAIRIQKSSITSSSATTAQRAGIEGCKHQCHPHHRSRRQLRRKAARRPYGTGGAPPNFHSE